MIWGKGTIVFSACFIPILPERFRQLYRTFDIEMDRFQFLCTEEFDALAILTLFLKLVVSASSS